MRFPFKKTKILIVIFGILVLVLLNFFQKEVKNLFYLGSQPLQNWLWQRGGELSDFSELISGFKNLKKENEELRLKNQELWHEILTLKEIKKENEFLKKALGIGLEKEFELDLAQVIGKDISGDLLLINKGERDGILKGLPVITEQKVLIGRISEVYGNFSKIILLTAKDFSFDAEISEKEIYGVAKGKGNFILSLEFLPIDKEIKEGDLVQTSILGGIFPKGLLVGEIKKIQKSDIESFQRAEIEPAFKIGDLRFLFIIKQW